MSTPIRQTPKVGTLEKLGFATFSTASNVVFNFKDLFYLFFLTNVMGISIAHAGIITAIGIVWDAINDPMVGFWAVNHKFKNGEKVPLCPLVCRSLGHHGGADVYLLRCGLRHEAGHCHGHLFPL